MPESDERRNRKTPWMSTGGESGFRFWLEDGARTRRESVR